MNPEAQQIAIAEACGWKFSWTAAGCHVTKPNGEDYGWDAWVNSRMEILDAAEVPNYLSDLNAMHEAEKVLTPEQANQYEIGLGIFNIATDPIDKRSIHATAAQRAEAFLRTLNLWTNS